MMNGLMIEKVMILNVVIAICGTLIVASNLVRGKRLRKLFKILFLYVPTEVAFISMGALMLLR